jgi:hypothetical protein
MRLARILLPANLHIPPRATGECDTAIAGTGEHAFQHRAHEAHVLLQCPVKDRSADILAMHRRHARDVPLQHRGGSPPANGQCGCPAASPMCHQPLDIRLAPGDRARVVMKRHAHTERGHALRQRGREQAGHSPSASFGRCEIDTNPCQPDVSTPPPPRAQKLPPPNQPETSVSR